MKLFICIFCCINQLINFIEIIEVKTFVEILKNVDIINIYKDGDVKYLNNNDDMFDSIIDEVENLFDNTREMPAFGVALNNEIVNSLKHGVWIEFNLKCFMRYNGMIFEKLLFQISKGVLGFNVIRFYDGKYEGRCYYFDLINKDMNSLYDKILMLNNFV